MTSESLICSIHRPALFFVLVFIDSYNQMKYVVKFTHLEQTLLVHSHQFFFSLKGCLELFLWRKQRNITLWNATWFGKPANRLPFKRQEKRSNNGCLNIRCPLSPPHSCNGTTLKINISLFLQREALNDNVMRNYMFINFGY